MVEGGPVSVDPAAGGLAALFEGDCPNHAMLFAALGGNVPCTALADRHEAARWCVLRTRYSVTFLSRGCPPAFASAAIERLRGEGEVNLVLRDRGEAEGLPPPDSWIPRVAFQGLDPAAASVAALLRKVPPGCEVRDMTSDLLARCLWRREVIAIFGEEGPFLRRCLGLCMVWGDEILAEAYAAFWTRGIVEIGAVTRADARGQGLAPVTCAHLVARCGARGCGTYWSCDAENLASQAVARKLGYESRSEYVMLSYAARPG